jgi:hypothetical protein
LKTLRYGYLILRSLLNVVLVHLRVDEPHKLALVILEHIPHIVFRGQIRLKMPNKLSGQLIQQHCMIVVADVVLVDQKNVLASSTLRPIR